MPTDANLQDGEREGLGDVVVGAGVERIDDVELVVPPGHDDDRPPRMTGPKLPAQVDSIAVGKSEIHQGDVVIVDAQRLTGRGHRDGVESAPAQSTLQAPTHASVVFDDQHSRSLSRAHHRRQLA